MLMPTMRTNVFDDLFNTPFFNKSESSMMKTDIKEHDNCYDLMIDRASRRRTSKPSLTTATSP